MLEQITELLAELAEARAAKEVLRLDKEAAIASAIPPEVKAALEDIEAEYSDRDLVAEYGATVKAAGLSAASVACE